MNLRRLVSGAISTVNPTVWASLQMSNGYTIAADGTRVPAYAPTQNVRVRVQSNPNPELTQFDGINLQGNTSCIYIMGDSLNGCVRQTMRGGDILTVGSMVWLVVQVNEQWPEWTRVTVCQQMSA